jgi:hypothetical protein
MRHPRTLTSALGGLALLLAACGGATDESPPASEDVDEAAPEAGEEDDADDTDSDDAEADAPADLGEFTEQAIAAAADGRGVTEEEVEVLRSEEVEWPDGARGCPEEGEMYTQAIVPGYLVVLDVAGEEQSWHGAEGEPPFHCEDPQTDVVADDE